MQATRDTGRPAQFLIFGALVGMLGGILMVLFTMIAAVTYLQMGFFTPLYAISAPLIGRQALDASITNGGLYFAAGPALLGLLIHLLWAAFWGMIFGLLVRVLHLTDGVAIISGVIYGFLIMLVMLFVVVPIVGAPDLPRLAGSLSFITAHALFYGIPLGLWAAAHQQFFVRAPAGQTVKEG